MAKQLWLVAHCTSQTQRDAEGTATEASTTTGKWFALYRGLVTCTCNRAFSRQRDSRRKRTHTHEHTHTLLQMQQSDIRT